MMKYLRILLEALPRYSTFHVKGLETERRYIERERHEHYIARRAAELKTKIITEAAVAVGAEADKILANNIALRRRSNLDRFFNGQDLAASHIARGMHEQVLAYRLLLSINVGDTWRRQDGTLATIEDIKGSKVYYRTVGGRRQSITTKSLRRMYTFAPKPLAIPSALV